MASRRILFLQGPPSPFFSRIGRQLTSLGHEVMAINLSLGDQLIWRGPNPVNYRGTLSDWPTYIADFLTEKKITDIILLGEQRPYHQHVLIAAKERDIQIVVTDFGYLRPDWLTFEREGMGADSRFTKDPEQIKALADKAPNFDPEIRYRDSATKMALWDMVYHFANFFCFWLFPHYRPYKRDNPLLLYPGTGIRLLFSSRNNKRALRQFKALRNSGNRYFVFPLQLENDFQITAYSSFNNLREPIRQVIKSFAENASESTRLLVKVHPWDPGLKNWGKTVRQIAAEFGVSGRVGYYDGGNLDEMIRGSAGMVTINSTSGLRALQLGCPVKLLGNAIFDIKGLVHQGALDHFWKSSVKPDAELLTAFIKAIAATIQIRGVYFSEPGLSAAVNTAVERLSKSKINELL